MAGCSQEIAGLPILTGCPSNTEMFLTTGASGGVGSGGYGLRSWANLVSCFAQILSFPQINTTVGAGAEPILVQGQTVFQTAANTIAGSILVSIGGVLLTQEISNQIYIGITYDTNNVATITFYNYSIDDPTDNLGLQNGMNVIIYYAISSSGSSVDTFDNTFDNTFS
jgi:hypothetical protein